MPENTTEQQNDKILIGGVILTMTSRDIKSHKREKQADGSNKSVEVTTTIVAPVIDSLATAVSFATAILSEAERREKGGAVKLADALYLDRIQEASAESFDLETGVEDSDKYVTILSRASRPRSAGLGKEGLNKELVSYTPEMLELNRASKTQDGWRGILAADGSARFTEEMEYLLRLDFVNNKMSQICAQIQALDLKHIESGKKRAEKAAKAEAAKKAEADVKAAEAAGVVK